MILEDRYRAAEGDHYDDDEHLPAAARPMFDKLSIFLLGSILAVAVVCLWTGFSWSATHG